MSETLVVDRTKALGASEIADVLGMGRGSAYEVWARKRGIMPEAEPTPAMLRGLKVEPLAVADFCERNEIPPLQVTTQQRVPHPKYPFLIATLDIRVLARNVPIAWEIKSTGHFSAKEWEKGVPAWAALQNCFQRALLQAAEGAEMSAGGVIHFPVEEMRGYDKGLAHDADLCEMVIEAGVRFWVDHVETGIPPAVSGTSKEAEVFKKLYARSEPGNVMVATPEQEARVLDALDSMTILNHAEKEHERRCLIVKEIMGDAERLVLSDGRELVWKTNKGSVSWKAVAEELGAPPELIRKHTPEVGARPFNLKKLLNPEDE